ncbi:Hypothetical predicted protein [Marmota monax]|uniref:Uncharacterized protein n=1 Tax=Marmota monax TaxID=9995 RepID=A0A5E4CKR9_MARMO|nr:Hypothetical predicted protein [Marmota monax]
MGLEMASHSCLSLSVPQNGLHSEEAAPISSPWGCPLKPLPRGKPSERPGLPGTPVSGRKSQASQGSGPVCEEGMGLGSCSGLFSNPTPASGRSWNSGGHLQAEWPWKTGLPCTGSSHLPNLHASRGWGL